MLHKSYNAPLLLQNGLAMTIYTARKASRNWEQTITETDPIYQEKIFTGAQGVPIYGVVAIPPKAHSTIVGTYGITGTIANQWFLNILARKAYAQGYAVVLFDWRAHGKTALLSPTLTSDGLYEGEDFLKIALEAKTMGCPAPFWFTGYSLGGQLALWGVKTAADHPDIAGGAVICPNLDSVRSLTYLHNHPLNKYIEKAITKELKKLVTLLHEVHPEAINGEAIARVNSIWDFDREFVITPLGFSRVEDYYEASNGLYILPQLQKPTLIIYAADDPMFDPRIIPDLKAGCAKNALIDLYLTPHGGHVGYLSSKNGQKLSQDEDQWWAINRVLEWLKRKKL